MRGGYDMDLKRGGEGERRGEGREKLGVAGWDWYVGDGGWALRCDSRLDIAFCCHWAVYV